MLSYGLVVALFFLGPGFATYAGLFAGFRGGRFQAAPPPPNSVFSLAVVGMASLFWHALWALLVATDDGLCQRHHGCLRVPYDPDVYSRALSVANARGTLGAADVAAFLLTCLLLSVVAFFASAALVRRDIVAERLRQPLYGLYADLVREAAQTASPPTSAAASDGGERRLPAPKYVIAYVLTDMEKDGGYLGYFGVLENLQVGADKQVAGVSLLDSDTFVLRIGPPTARTPGQRGQLIDRIIIGGARIQNVAFEVVELA